MGRREGASRRERNGHQAGPPSPPRILIATILPPGGPTGVHTHVREFGSYLRAHGEPYEVIRPLSARKALATVVFAFRFLLRHVSSGADVWWYRFWHGVFLRHALARALRDGSDAVIYAQCPVSAHAALRARRRRRQPVVMAVHFEASQADEWVYRGHIRQEGLVYRSIRSFEAQTLTRLDGIVFVSRSAREDIASWLPAVLDVPHTIIPNFVSPFDRDRTFEPGWEADLVSVGSLETVKNHGFLLEVLAAANCMGRRFTLDIVGGGSRHAELQQLALELAVGDQVRFLGQCPDVRARLSGYRVYVHSSTHEVLPFAIIEALGAGLPIVAGPFGGVPELFEPGVEGVLWPLDDPEEAARVLIDFTSDPRELALTAKRARLRFIKSFDLSVAAPALYAYLMSSAGRQVWVEHVAATRRITTAGGNGPQRAVSFRAAVTTVDQCVASVSNFAVGVAVARFAGVSGLGAYSLAYTAWLILAAAHRSLVTDPMAIENDLRNADARLHVRAGLAAELLLGVLCVAAFLGLGVALLSAHQHAYGIGFIATAPWLPFLLLQDYWRWIGFMQARPGRALTNDLIFLIVQVGAFAVLFGLHVRSTVVAIGGWGVGALVGAMYGLWQFRVSPSFQHGFRRLRMRWSMSKWLLGESASQWGASQAFVVLAGILLGPIGLGGLKAASNLVNGPSLVLLQAGGSVGLPEASRALAERGWLGLRRVSHFVNIASVLSVAAIGAVIFLYGRQLLSALYGHEFGRYAMVANIVALATLVGAFRVGAFLVLKATRRSCDLFVLSMINLIASVVAVLALAPIFGIVGAAVSTLIATAFSTVITVGLQRRRTVCRNEPTSVRPVCQPVLLSETVPAEAGIIQPETLAASEPVTR